MRLNLGDFALHYLWEGPDGAPWLTFSNSLVCSLSMWDGQAERLRDRFRVLRYDVRGHGQSEAAPPPYTIDQLAEDVLALWNHLGIQRSHFVGLSLGGMTGIALALARPDRVTSLVAADCRAEADEAYAAMFAGRIETTRREGIETLVEPTLARFFTSDFATAYPETVSRYAAMIRQTSADGHIGCCQAIAGARYFARLPELKVPTIFLGGRHDIGAPVKIMRAMHEAVSGSRHVVLEKAGHISCEEAPDAFAAVVTENIERSAPHGGLQEEGA